MAYYYIIDNKNKWNKVLNNHIIPQIKNTSSKLNADWEVQKVNYENKKI